MDLCYRVKKVGWNICYLGSAMVVHHGGQSSKKKGGEEFSGPMVKQSVFTFFQKTRGQLYACLYRAMMFKVALIRMCILGGGFRCFLPRVLARTRCATPCENGARSSAGLLAWNRGPDASENPRDNLRALGEPDRPARGAGAPSGTGSPGPHKGGF